MKIGFIGLGIMGKPMVRNLLKAGHEVWVNNRSKAPMEELAKDGAHAVSRQELAENAEIIITMLPNGPQVKEVMLGGCGQLHARRSDIHRLQLHQPRGLQGDRRGSGGERRRNAGRPRFRRRAKGH